MSTDIDDDYREIVAHLDRIADVGDRHLARMALDRLRYKAEFNLDAVLKRLKAARIAKAIDDERKGR